MVSVDQMMKLCAFILILCASFKLGEYEAKKWEEFKKKNNCKLIEVSDYSDNNRYDCNGIIYTGD